MLRFVLAVLLVATAGPAFAADPGEEAFRSLYKELVETNTVVNHGSCTAAAGNVAARLAAAGYGDGDLTLFSVPEHPEDGGLVAVLPGSDGGAKAILLLAHIDVVEAKREDWERDPFQLVEEDGYFYGRGVADDKSQAAIFADTMIRLKKAPPLRRTVKMALTCGEETSGAFNGAEWLANNRRQLIDAEFALNEGGGGRYDETGRPQLLSLQAGEKHYRDFLFEVTNPGGHSSVPRPGNAIYSLGKAISAISSYRFPVRFNDVTRAYFTTVGGMVGGETGAAMVALAANPEDRDAEAVVAADPPRDSMLRTTCVATMAEAGHARNALPQRAVANINCRIVPGETVESTLSTLQQLVNDPQVSITPRPESKEVAQLPPLTKRIMEPIERLSGKYFPGVPVIPTMLTGATDGPYLAAVGIPVYGVPGVLGEADGGGTHGLNERIRVQSLLAGRAYLYDLIRDYAGS